MEKIKDDSKRTWLLNRMNGEIEVFMEGSATASKPLNY